MGGRGWPWMANVHNVPGTACAPSDAKGGSGLCRACAVPGARVTFPPCWLSFPPGPLPSLARTQTIPAHLSLPPAAATCPVLARPLAASSDLQSRQRLPGRRIVHRVRPEKLFLTQPRCCRCPHARGSQLGQGRARFTGGRWLRVHPGVSGSHARVAAASPPIRVSPVDESPVALARLAGPSGPCQGSS